jgi:hypothetical protein
MEQSERALTKAQGFSKLHESLSTTADNGLIFVITVAITSISILYLITISYQTMLHDQLHT